MCANSVVPPESGETYRLGLLGSPASLHCCSVSVTVPAASQVGWSYPVAALGPPTLTKAPAVVVTPSLTKHSGLPMHAAVAATPSEWSVHVASSTAHNGGLAGGGAAGDSGHMMRFWFVPTLGVLISSSVPPVPKKACPW